MERINLDDTKKELYMYTNDFSGLLASYSVTKTLYDTGKDLFDILVKYITVVILENRKYSFDLTWITSQLNSMGGFNLREPVVKTCLKQMHINHVGVDYACDPSALQVDKDWKKAFDESRNDNQYLINVFAEYLKNNVEGLNHEYDEREISETIKEYLMDEIAPSDSQRNKYFSEFVVDRSDDERVNSVLRNLKEGLIIHEGIKYCDDVSEVNSSWKGRITLILDTEVLMGICGLNSCLLQEYCRDFINYVKELNLKAKKGNHISLRYFSETHDEIENFFGVARRIIKGLDIADPTKEAIQQITSGCESLSELERRRSLFYDTLEKMGIVKVDRDFYDQHIQDNITYNIEEYSIEEKYSREWNVSREDIHRSMAALSHINILRKGKSDLPFEKCEATFVTATNRTKKLAFATEIYKESDAPLATSLEFVINRFWFRLHKGFGEGSKPSTLDMISQARTILSGMLTDRVYSEYQKLKCEYENGKMSKEQFVIANNDLKDQLRRPEEIDSERIEMEIQMMEKWDFEEVNANYTHQKGLLVDAVHENEELSNQLQREKNERRSSEELNKKYQIQLSQKDDQLHRSIQEIEEKDKRIRELEKKEQQRAERKKRMKRIVGILAIIIIVGIILFGIIYYVVGTRYGWKYSNTIGAIFTVVGTLGMLTSIVVKFARKWGIK